MKKIITLLSNYIRYELKATYLINLLLFLIPITALNYYFNFESGILKTCNKEWYFFILCFFYYAIPLFYAVLVYAIQFNKKELFKNKRFLFLICFFPAIMAFDEAFHWHHELANGIQDEILKYYIKKVLNQSVRFVTYFLPILLYYIFLEKENNNFYGLAFKKSDLKPYLFMLFGIMMPLIVLVSFTDDFQSAYPVYNMSQFKEQLPGTHFQQVALYESMYLFDFINIELLFRGIMIHALYKYMGIECVLAVATVYCTFHFGKPVIETASSFFGGTILGILSLRTNSLMGGIIVHAGIALMMELASFAHQLHFFGL
ncbi:CPBP family intramembrane glutamic endopeptidase [uncultured Cytophaga sp.]|uniref:CPBP family intramembrane glutamic endopeptidase n=1 Tax=uncultured Cytophaga sp. TaxID=160238 RepID=UPI0026280512|nr:CPBP family intramembrane glutamic endopeptidase [uncultured Cytophaga sp.]